MTARIYCLLARESSAAVIFRRGPSKQVRLIRWDRDGDTFEPGQWLKGRIYERRCDLSPDGELLVYFAATYRLPLYSWTAISRPPYFTALALWAKGDGWGGGGLFASARKLELNHRAGEDRLHDDYVLPRKYSVSLFGRAPGWGEDNPILHARLVRDGWILTSPGGKVDANFGATLVWDFSKNPIVYSKVSFPKHNTLVLESRVKGVNRRGGAWYQMDHFVFDKAGETVLSLEDSDWADWDANGDLLFAREGRLFRAKRRVSRKVKGKAPERLAEPTVIFNMNGMRFTGVRPPKKALEW